MWSKRPKPGGKGLRRQIKVNRDGSDVACDRPAKRFKYEQPEVAHWIAPLKPEAAMLDCCIGHLRKLVNEGARLEQVDMRRGKKLSVDRKA
jgi:hypothetical protein